MKVRTCFVSNSSSASFILNKHWISDNQLKLLKWYLESKDNADEWSIVDEDDDKIEIFTSMDNDVMKEFFKGINLGMRALIEERYS